MSTSDSMSAIILAAGKGTRMKSTTPKVLHAIAGRPMVGWVLKAVKDAGFKQVSLVLGPDTDRYESFLKTHPHLNVAIQHHQKGTGDAVASAAAAFEGATVPSYTHGELRFGSKLNSEWAMIVTGDTPAIQAMTLKNFAEQLLKSGKSLGVLGMNAHDPRGYGRLVRDAKGGLSRIVEERDADPETKKITLCNSGIVMGRTKRIFELLGNISPNNSQNEYYLTDIFGLAARAGEPAFVFDQGEAREFAGVNDRVQLESMERWLLEQRYQDLMRAGVTLHRPETIYIEANVDLEQDVEVFPGANLLGTTKISRGVSIGPSAVLTDTLVGAGSVIGANSVLTRMKVMAGSHVPPGTFRTELDF